MAPPSLAAAAALLAPPLCAACASACGRAESLCEGCRRSLAATASGRCELAGVGPLSWVAPYDGIAAELVGALKFHARLPLARVIGEAIADRAAAGSLPAARLVAVPAARSRRRRRGFDPAELIASAAARRLDRELASALRRDDGPRQVGRDRAERLARPPRVRALGRAPPVVLLVDDVLTTGATLRACATALREAGTIHLRAAVFARAVGGSGRGA